MVKSNHARTISKEPLKGKVALLFRGANVDGRSLASSLAKYGANIAIVYRQDHVGQAQAIKKLVEAGGRRCLIIPAPANDKASSKEVILETIETLGGLDIFIDYSAAPSDKKTVTDFLVNRSKMNLRVAQELINKPIISINGGLELGKVQGFYLDQDMTHLTAIYLGKEGLLSRTETLVNLSDVVTLGRDAILVKDTDAVMDKAEGEEFDSYIRRDEIGDRPVDTPGGTKIGRIGDIVLDDEAKIVGFSLSQTFVSGPIAANRVISRKAIVDTGNEDGVMTVNLSQAEKPDLQVVYEGLFTGPSISSTKPEEPVAEAN